jgi:hypothetical protein
MKILGGTDFSPNPADALETASASACRFNDNVHVVHSARPLLGAADGDIVGVAPRRKRQRVEPGFDGGNDLRMAEAHLTHVVAVKIQISAPLGIDQPRALRTGQGIQARRGQRLVQEAVRIGRQQGGHVGTNAVGQPLAPGIGGVHIAFGRPVGMEGHWRKKAGTE